MYPYDRSFTNFGYMANHKYRVSTPPKIYPASRNPKEWAMHVERTRSESPDDPVTIISRVGKDTSDRRTARFVKENSKGVQCDAA